ncbi:MAG: sugar ABC transporter substrate-binding protein [Solirubrobacteraceae bacterium]
MCTAAALALTVTACGDDDDEPAGAGSSSSGGGDVVAATQAKLDGHDKADKIGPTTPIEEAIPKGKKITFVNCGAPACVNFGKALKTGADVLGWKVTEIAAQPTPPSVQAAFDEAIRQRPDAVVSMGLGRDLYAKQLDRLGDMKIPVMSNTGTEETGEGGIAFEPLGPKASAEAAARLADRTIVDLEGEGQIGSVLLGGFPVVKDYTEGYEREIEAACPDCSIKRLDIQPASLGKDAPQKIANFLRANPDLKGLFISYDLLASGLPAAAKAAGVTVPKSYSFAPDEPGIQALQTGERTAALIEPYNELAWQIVDALARTFTGRDVSESQPLQTLTIVSKDEGNLPKTADPFPAMVEDYQSQFKRLWGVEG